MTAYFWNWDYFAEWAARLVRVEKKFSHEQLEYLHQYYMINKFAKPPELQAIAKQWNIDYFDFYLDLNEWFSGRRIAELEILQRREEARKTAA